MAEVPQIVRERLKGQQTDSTTEHPDANLFSAFAEHKLTDRERLGVLQHLSQCAECRDVVARVAPEVEQEEKVVSALPAGRRSWWRSPVLHWGALTTAALVVVIAVGERMRLREGHSASAPAVAREMSQKPSAPTLEVPIAAGESSKSAPVSAPTPHSTANSSQDKLATRENTNSDAAGSKRAIVSNEAALSASAQSAAPAPVRRNTETVVRGIGTGTGGGVGPGMLRLPSGPSGSIEARNVSPPAPTTPPANMPSGNAGLQSFDKSQRSQSPIVASSADAVGEATAAGAPKPKKANPAATDQFSTMAKQVSVAARWSISDSGVLQRSLDGGRTWKAVAVGGGITFRTVAAMNNDVWAGGSGGALFHSIDAGEHWLRVRVHEDDRALSGDVVHIEFTDHANGALITSSGERWATSDGGVHWH